MMPIDPPLRGIRTPGWTMTRHHRGLRLLGTCALAADLLMMPMVSAAAWDVVPARSHHHHHPHHHHHAGLPVITRLSPSSGPVGGGTVVTISGHGFTKVKKVLFGGSRAGDVSRHGSKQLRVTAPPHPAGSVDVRVMTRHGKSKVVTADRFTYTTSAAAALTAGRYSGGDAQGRAVSLYVSSDGHSLQDVSVPLVDLSCVPSAVVDDKIQILSVSVAADGSFASTTTQSGILAGHTVLFTYVFRGHVDGPTSLSGTLRESVSNTDSPARDCTSNDQAWSATRETQPAQPTTPPAAGSYSGGDTQGRALRFYVAADGASLQDVTVPLVDLGCVPAAVVDDKIQIDSVPLAPDGSFSSTTQQTGVLGGNPVVFTYVFRGHVHGVDAAGVPRLAGVLRESVSNTGGPARDCTSNDQAWSATRETQPAQPTTPPAAGSYSGSDTQGRALTFSVAPGGGAIQDVSVPLVDLSCVPSAVINDKIQVATITIDPDGSFSSTTQQTGTLNGHPVVFTYVFRGHVHGVGPTGVSRLAGQLRESVSNTDTTPRDCTSNDQAWNAQAS
jgi:hypothetical protein